MAEIKTVLIHIPDDAQEKAHVKAEELAVKTLERSGVPREFITKESERDGDATKITFSGPVSQTIVELQAKYEQQSAQLVEYVERIPALRSANARSERDTMTPT